MMEERMSRLQQLCVFHDDHQAGEELVRELQRRGVDTAARASAWTECGDAGWGRCAPRFTTWAKRSGDYWLGRCLPHAYMDAIESSTMEEYLALTPPPFGLEGQWGRYGDGHEIPELGREGWDGAVRGAMVTVGEDVDAEGVAVAVRFYLMDGTITFRWTRYGRRTTPSQWLDDPGEGQADEWYTAWRDDSIDWEKVQTGDDIDNARTLRRVLEILEERQRGLRA